VPRQASVSQRPPAERVLLRRLYFLNSNRSKYVCLGFYPNRGYRAFFELGGVRQAPVVLTPSLIPSLALHLPKLCDHLDKGEQYKCNVMSFRMQTVAEISAKIVLDHTSVTLRLHELQYLVLNLTTLANQVARFKLAAADVSAYVQIAVGAVNFVPPKESSILYVQYDVLFEEINKYVFP
jgi:hypothetical protein